MIYAMKDVTDMARTHARSGRPGGRPPVPPEGRRRRLATIGATALTAAAIAVAGCTAETASAAPAAFAKPAATAVTAAKTVTTSVTAPAAYTPPTRNLAPGMKGADVKALQQRLSALKYYLGKIDGQFGGDTQAALWAFQEINGIKVTGVVDAATKKALVHPKTYKSPSYAGKRATRVEVSQALEVLVLFKNNKISLISHVSSGGGYFYNCGSGAHRPSPPTAPTTPRSTCPAGSRCRSARCTTRCSSSARCSPSTVTPTCRRARPRTAASGSR